jgi:hypothetical protein
MLQGVSDGAADDWFGFRAEEELEQRRSLPVSRQLVVHAALDRWEELCLGQLPAYKKVNVEQPHWMGALLEEKGQVVFGFVTATNIKIFVLAAAAEKAETAALQLCSDLHQHYLAYVMNPFSSVKGNIESKKFDESVQSSLRRVCSA